MALLIVGVIALVTPAGWAGGSVDDLRVGSIVEVDLYERKDGSLYARGIGVSSVSVPEFTLSGRVTAVDAKARTVTILGETVTIPKGIRMLGPARGLIDVDGVKVGLKFGVEFEYHEDGSRTVIRAKAKEYGPTKDSREGGISGVVEALDLKKGTITVLGREWEITPETDFEADFESLGPMILAGYGLDRWTGAALRRRFSTCGEGDLNAVDVAGIAFYGPGNSIFITDSEIEDGPHFKGKNLFEISAETGTPMRAFSTLGYTAEPTGMAYHPTRGTFFFTDDDKKHIYEVDLEGNVVGGFSTKAHNMPDPEGVAVDTKTGNLWVAGGARRDIWHFTAEGEFKSRFNVARSGMQDPEGIAFDPSTGNLLLASGPNLAIFEFTQKGRLAGIYSLVYSGSLGCEAATMGPSSDPNDDPSVMSLYVGSAGVLEEKDGSVFEFALCRAPIGATLRRNMVGDMDGFGFSDDAPGFKEVDHNGNGMLDLNESLPNLDGKRGIVLEKGSDGFDNRLDKKREGLTDIGVNVTEDKPLRLVHKFDLRGAKAVRARVTLVVADSRALPGRRMEVYIGGQLAGEVLGAAGLGFTTGDGAIVRSTFEVAPELLSKMSSGELVVELRRPAGAGADDIAVDYSMLEYAVNPGG